MSLAALAAGAGAGNASATSLPATAATSVTWHKLTLINGWAPIGNSYRRSPSYAISGGVVYLTGWLTCLAGAAERGAGAGAWRVR